MPRLYREAPLASIWEGSGNVMSLDVLRALVRTPRSLEVFLHEVAMAQGADARLDAHVAELEASSRDPATLEAARGVWSSDGARAAGLAAGAPRRPRCRRRLLRRAPGRRRGPRVRHAARGQRLRGDHRARAAPQRPARLQPTADRVANMGDMPTRRRRIQLTRVFGIRVGVGVSWFLSCSSSSSRSPESSTKCWAARATPPIW